ncbi:MAG TPA: hypothetical protein VIO11_05640 [Candidatus Methanoperedens sp.]
MRLTKKVTVYIPDELDEWIKNEMPRNVNLSEEVRNFLYSLRDKYTNEKPKVIA